jgi:hypothetical protein
MTDTAGSSVRPHIAVEWAYFLTAAFFFAYLLV